MSRKSKNITSPQTKNLISHALRRKNMSKLLRILGPGLITGAADDDPSGVITYSQAGAAYGSGFLWSFPFMFPFLVAVQGTCEKIGAVTGKGLATIIKENYSKVLLYVSIVMVVVANTINIGADLGAMAATTQLFFNLPFYALVLLYVFVIVLLVVFVSYRKYAKILKWLAVALFAYPAVAFLVKNNWAELFRATFATIPKIDAGSIYILVGLLGTTISPYCFFWDTSEAVEEEIAHGRLQKTTGKAPKISRKYLSHIRIDNVFGMALSEIIGWFIVVTCASVLFSHNVTNINTAADAASALEPLVSGFPYAGLIAKIIFSVGIIGIGLLAVPILAGSSAYAISEACGWREGLYHKLRRAKGFYLVIVMAVAVGIAVSLIGIDPIQALIFTAVFNGIAAVPLIFMIARIGGNKKIMGEYRNRLLGNTFMWLAFVVMAAAAVALFYFALTGQLH